MRSRVFVPPPLQKLKELLRAPLLEQTHQGAPDCLQLRARHLGDLAIAVDEATCDLFELKIPSNIGMDEDFSQLS